MNVGNWLYKRSLVSPHRDAILYDDRALTYLRMNQRVNRLCHALSGMGLSKGDRAAVLSRNCPEFLEVYFACAKLGLIFVPMNFRMAPPEIAYQINDSSPGAVFFHAELESQIQGSERFLNTEPPAYVAWGGNRMQGARDYETVLEGERDHEPDVAEGGVTLDTDQMIMYTSGTTGTPKGALLSHRKCLFNTLNAQIYFDLCSRDTMLVALPLFHSGGLNIMAVPTLYSGGKVILKPQFDPHAFLDDVEMHGVTQAMLVPTMLNTILKEAHPEKRDLSSLRSVLIGGEPVSGDIMNEARDRGLPVRQIFGQTETSIELWVPEDMAREKAGAVGVPVFHSEVRVVSESGETVKPGDIGEIVVKGPIQMTAYWNLPEETAETIRDGWLHTRDLGRMDEDGFIFAVDRMGDMYISGGENVYPAEVERVLMSHPKVFEAAIVGLPDDKWGMSGHAFVRPREGEAIAFDEIVSFLRERVAAYKIPNSMEIVDEFPKTGSGKIKKTELMKSR
ncbi:MAG: long-chain fatty acid--CoA ligase [Deltaproteobacteria bacterium]|nr:long-chain fatty acid--CoA ligase [Deltaproteobacteria bacterium]